MTHLRNNPTAKAIIAATPPISRVSTEEIRAFILMTLAFTAPIPRKAAAVRTADTPNWYGCSAGNALPPT